MYTHADGRPASTWDLKQEPDLIRSHGRGTGSRYTTPEQFRAAAISEYPPDAAGEYRVAGINPYYRSILEMAARGWPGGLRWLHGEDGGSGGPEGRS